MENGLPWRTLTADDLPALVALASRCLAADGGLPLAAEEAFLRPRFAAPEVTAWSLGGDRLIAAGAVRIRQQEGVRQAVVTGLVDPAYRGRGIGAALLDRVLDHGRRSAPAVVVDSESLTAGAEALFLDRGLRRTFAEDVLRFDLSMPPPAIRLPPEAEVSTWTAELAPRFFAVYRAAFADRPGFPDWPRERWVAWTAGDDEFRPPWSLLATGPEGDLGFITCAEGWIIQVGVRPDRRGRRLGAGLVAEALRRMRADGRPAALLDVNVDNPAGELYRSLGFASVGRRARFEPAR